MSNTRDLIVYKGNNIGSCRFYVMWFHMFVYEHVGLRLDC